MLSYIIFLDKRRLTRKNEYPVKLRLYEGGELAEMSLKISVADRYWKSEIQSVKKSHQYADRYNATISDFRSRVDKLLLQAQAEGKRLSPKQVVQQLKHPREYRQINTLTDFANSRIELLNASGKVGTAISYSCAIGKLTSFLGRSQCTFEELTYKELVSFEVAMLKENMKVNTISVYMRAIRALYNQAIREEVISATVYPFRAFKIISAKTPTTSLTREELSRIAHLQIERETPMWHWRNYFLLSFCLIGINFADLLTLRKVDIVDGRVVFQRSKTGKLYSIKLHDAAYSILRTYRASRELLLPVLKQTKDARILKRDINQARKTCNKYLNRMAENCGINKRITTYTARYSWANIARSVGYSKDLIAEALGHEYGNKVTSIYLGAYDAKKIDEANRIVIKSVFKSEGSR